VLIGVDFVESRETKTPATAACRKAWEFAIDNRLITQFGGFGSDAYKFKPPLTTPQAEFNRMLDILGGCCGLHPAGTGSATQGG
jgi:4-aminobutyrate aminotransferase-like enzyme